MEKTKLNNGIEIPCVGIGTFTMSPEDAESAVGRALKMGTDSLILQMLM